MATKNRWFSNPSGDEPSVWTRVVLMIALLAIGVMAGWYFFGHKKASVDLSIRSIDEFNQAVEQRKDLDKKIDEFVRVYSAGAQTWENIKSSSSQPTTVASKPADSPSVKAPGFAPGVSPSGK